MYSVFNLIFVVEDREKCFHKSSVSNEDKKLTIAFTQNDASAFENIFSLYNEAIYRFVYKYLKNREAALDVVQDSFTRLLANRQKIKPDKGIKDFLYKIALNLCYDELRKSKRRKTESYDTLVDEKGFQFKGNVKSPEHDSIMLEMEDFLTGIIDSLPKKEKDALLMKRMSGMTCSEIGRVLGFSERSARKYVKTSLDKINTCFEKAGFTKGGKIII